MNAVNVIFEPLEVRPLYLAVGERGKHPEQEVESFEEEAQGWDVQQGEEFALVHLNRSP